MSRKESRIRAAIRKLEDEKRRRAENARFEFQSSILSPGCRVAEMPPSPLRHDERERLKSDLQYRSIINVVCAILVRSQAENHLIGDAIDPLLDDLPSRPGALELLGSILEEWEQAFDEAKQQKS